MTIAVGCPDCGKMFKVPDSLAGKKGRCKSCGGSFQVPATMEAMPGGRPVLRPGIADAAPEKLPGPGAG